MAILLAFENFFKRNSNFPNILTVISNWKFSVKAIILFGARPPLTIKNRWSTDYYSKGDFRGLENYVQF